MTSAPTLPTLTLLELHDVTAETGGLESYSPFCVKVSRALNLLRLPYQRRCSANPRVHRRHSLTGQLPVLLIGDEAVQDSTDILARVDALAGGALRRTPEALLWEELADSAVYGFLLAARFADDRNWPATRAGMLAGLPGLLHGLVRRRILRHLVGRDLWRAGPELCWRRFGEQLDQLDARAPGEGYWLGGDRPGIADLSLFAQLQSHRTALTPWQRGEVEKRQRLRAWLDRVDAATLPTSADSPRG